MENCRVVLTPHDAVSRIESLVAYYSQEVIDRGRTYIVEVAADEDCLALASGLYDKLNFTGCVSTVWTRAFEAESYSRLWKSAEEYAASLGLSLDLNPPQEVESSDAHRQRVIEAFQRASLEAKIIIVPIETMAVLCQVMRYDGEILAFIPQRDLPKRFTVSKYRDFCARQGLAASRDESLVDLHCGDLLPRREGAALVVAVVSGELRVRVKDDARAQVITEEAKELLAFVGDQMQREDSDFGRRKAYHQTVLKTLTRCWQSLAAQLRALLPAEKSGCYQEVCEQLDRIEAQRTEDRLQLRGLPSMDDYDKLAGEVERVKANLEAERQMWQRRLENAQKENEEIMQKMVEIQRGKDSAAAPMVTLGYKATEPAKLQFQVSSTEDLTGISLEWYTATHCHTCLSNISLARGITDISVHRHYFQGESNYVLRRGGQAVSNPLLIPMHNINLYGAILSQTECEELEKVLSELGHEYAKPEAVRRTVELLRKPGHWTGYRALAQICRDTFAVAE